jgi:photosynthetic reaction center cytochrome c subunit
MKRKLLPAGRTALAVALATLVLKLPAVRAQGTPAKTAEQAFKNIQVLKGAPADQLIPSMQFITASLGVECEYCHVAGSFEKDDKKPKQTARKMMEMMFAINKGHFDDHRELTCYTCHHGLAHPVAVPVIPEEENKLAHAEGAESADGNETKSEDGGANSKAVVDATLEKYVRALGGAAAIQKVTSRIEVGSANLAGRQFPIDIYMQAPDKRVSVMHLPNGESITAYNGSTGWLSAPGRPPHWMNQSEAEAARLDAELYLPVKMKQIFSDFRQTTEKIDGRDVTVLRGLREGKPSVSFYFDQESGLLVRLVRYTDTVLGLNPTQIDYADYRESGGVKIPHRWTLARPGGRFTIQVEKVQQNVPINEQQFAAPAEEKPPAH